MRGPQRFGPGVAAVCLVALTAPSAYLPGSSCAAASPRQLDAQEDGHGLTKNDERPNIVLILLDDVDTVDIGVYGSPDIQTPILDAFCEESMRFTQYYACAPVCSPSRLSILTGNFPHHLGIKHIILPDSFRGIPDDVINLAEVLQAAGYRTGHVGKWHLGEKKEQYSPVEQGFDRVVKRVAGSHYVDFQLSFDGGPPVLFDQGEHLTEVLTDHAIEFIHDQSAQDDTEVQNHLDREPFFLNLWYNSAHAPWVMPSGFDNDPYDYDLATKRGLFSTMVSHVDGQIGRILDALRETGMERNTVVVITSDNGGGQPAHANVTGRLYRGFKRDLFEGGIRVPLMVRWPRSIPAGLENDSLVAGLDLFPTLAEIAEADVNGTELRGESIVETLMTGVHRNRERPLFWEWRVSLSFISRADGVYNKYAVRDGPWKLVFENDFEGQPVALYDISRDARELRNLANQFPETVQRLQGLYYQWRRKIGELMLEPSISGSVTSGDGRLTFSGAGGVATVAPRTSYDFHDGNFTFLVTIRPEDTALGGVIAQKASSWRLLIRNGRLELEIQPRPSEASVIILVGPPLASGREHRVGFTIQGWISDDDTVRLYVDGKIEAELFTGAPEVNTSDEPILLGNDELSRRPFLGELRDLRASLLCLYPAEVVEDCLP